MNTTRMIAGVALTLLLGLPGIAWAETAEQAFAQGRTLLAQGDFQGALSAYATAARGDRANQDYLRQYMTVRRIIDLRQRLDVEQDPVRWEYTARALRSAYINERIYPAALALEQQIHTRLNTAESAAMLAETQLATDRNAEAAAVLSALGPAKATPATQALLGIALARQGKAAAAKQLAQGLSLPQGAGPGEVYAVARLEAVTGGSAKALSLLRSCFESVPPSRLEGFKAHAQVCPEFAGLPAADFKAALQTKSKIAESSCSGGSGCAGCPMRGKCAGSQGN